MTFHPDDAVVEKGAPLPRRIMRYSEAQRLGLEGIEAAALSCGAPTHGVATRFCTDAPGFCPCWGTHPVLEANESP